MTEQIDFGMLSPMKNTQKLFGNSFQLFIILVLVIVVVQSFIRPKFTQSAPAMNAECVGVALAVDYPFQGGFLDPHACKPQCDDGKQRYIVYNNGKATQCQILPGCLDWGEDRGVTCTPPGEMTSTSEEASS